MADSSPKDPLSTTLRDSSSSVLGDGGGAPSSRDTIATPVVRESDAASLVKEGRGASPAAPKEGRASVPGPKDPRGSRVSVPPSEPRGSRTSLSQIDLSTDRPARLQLIVALVLMLVLVAIPLYLWRRPRAESLAVATSDGGTAAELAAPAPPADDGKPVMGEPKVLSCHDPGPKKTAPEQCDRPADIEKALVKAIEETASCVPRDAGGGALVFVADVSFKRKSVGVAMPKEGRTLKSARAVAACQAAVKAKLGSLAEGATPHAHARYRIAVTATYAPSAPSAPNAPNAPNAPSAPNAPNAPK